MRMGVPQGLVAMPVRMRLADRLDVPVPMVLVMDVAVLVFKRGVVVFVLVAFGQVQPKPQPHESAGDNEPCRQWLVQ